MNIHQILILCTLDLMEMLNHLSIGLNFLVGYFGVMTPPFSVKLRHFEKSYNYKKILGLYTL